ncbi:TetR/AcrR family transcriptional regulator [Saccharospirillum mangrovi]|uniref:TetR/AcrR family transcriptional regulator n=1 Tax=Saccharospirillum mangrovi TaxID=2161747 RepID=UPI000E205F79|nr:TetR/AcrR family transcriptional regulator [Saccharospirillum mangrovi]
MTQSTPSAQRRSNLKHRAILDAAAQAVAQQGYAAVTIEGVAALAGVGKQTIYRWWSSKAALLVEVYSDLVSRQALTPRSNGSLEQRLTGLLSALFRLYRSSSAGAILTGLIGEASRDEQVRAVLAEGLVVGRADIVTALVQAADASLNAQAVNEVVIAVVWQRLVLQPDSLDEAFAQHLAALALAAGRLS